MSQKPVKPLHEGNIRGNTKGNEKPAGNNGQLVSQGPKKPPPPKR
jgi:hypothetical protein